MTPFLFQMNYKKCLHKVIFQILTKNRTNKFNLVLSFHWHIIN